MNITFFIAIMAHNYFYKRISAFSYKQIVALKKYHLLSFGALELNLCLCELFTIFNMTKQVALNICIHMYILISERVNMYHFNIICLRFEIHA